MLPERTRLMFEFDPHTHSIASGHASSSTITDMAKKAASLRLKMLGITDHGPATLCAGRPSYFRSLTFAPKKRFGIEILYGVELNILNRDGSTDLASEILKDLDYAIASMHPQNFKPGTAQYNTDAYINAMKSPYVKIIGHCDDTKYPVDYETLTKAAKQYHVLLEINNSSLSPDGYRGDTKANASRILDCCLRHSHPVILSSDSHGTGHIGDFRYASSLIEETGFPKELILNYSLDAFKAFLKLK